MDDVQLAIRNVHTSGIFHRHVSENMDQYIIPSPHLPQLFQHLKNGNKKLFLCTNSDFQYANKTLSYILKLPYSHCGTSWKNIFDISICSSRKPDFYKSQRPFRKWNCDTDRSVSCLYCKSDNLEFIY